MGGRVIDGANVTGLVEVVIGVEFWAEVTSDSVGSSSWNPGNPQPTAIIDKTKSSVIIFFINC